MECNNLPMIGSLVSCPALDNITPFRVDAIWLDEDGQYILKMYVNTHPTRSVMTMNLSMAQGIPLTANILRNSGWKKALRVAHAFTRFGIDLVDTDDGLYWNRTGLKVPFVHNLQQLVFVMTGERAFINLRK